jgi:hypothetical protein
MSNERLERMKEIMRPIDRQIMLCDDRNDLFLLASAMMITSKNIFKNFLGKEGALEILEKVIKDLDDE